MSEDHYSEMKWWWKDCMPPGRSENKSWVRRKTWPGPDMKYERSEAMIALVTKEQDETLRALERNVIAAERTAISDLKREYPDFKAPWSHAKARELALGYRRYLSTFEIMPGSLAFVACERAYLKMLQIGRDQRRQLLALGVRPGHVPTVRLPLGVGYGAPLEVIGQTDTVQWWKTNGVGDLGVLAPFWPNVPDAHHVEMARIATNWRVRLIWAVGLGGVSEPPGDADAPSVVDE